MESWLKTNFYKLIYNKNTIKFILSRKVFKDYIKNNYIW